MQTGLNNYTLYTCTMLKPGHSGLVKNLPYYTDDTIVTFSHFNHLLTNTSAYKVGERYNHVSTTVYGMCLDRIFGGTDIFKHPHSCRMEIPNPSCRTARWSVTFADTGKRICNISEIYCLGFNLAPLLKL